MLQPPLPNPTPPLDTHARTYTPERSTGPPRSLERWAPTSGDLTFSPAIRASEEVLKVLARLLTGFEQKRRQSLPETEVARVQGERGADALGAHPTTSGLF